MDNSFLKDINRKIRQARPVITSSDSCEIYQTDSILEVSLSRGRCANDKRGACIMCDYGIASKDMPIKEYLLRMEEALKTCRDTVHCLMLCTNGSLFDEAQVETELLEGALDLASKSAIPSVQLESHYLDVTNEKLKMVKKKLGNKKIIIALGLETVNQEYQDLIIGKKIKIISFEEKIALIKSFGFDVELNIMLGLPFLSTNEQFLDTMNTIKWVYSHQCRPVLFPINIKPYTLLMEMYQMNLYSPISHWLVIFLLGQLTEAELSRIILVWYGNRIEYYDNAKLQQIPPVSCEKCSSMIKRFYTEFNAALSGSERKRILNVMLNKHPCDCLDKVQNELHKENCLDFYSQYAKCIDTLNMVKGCSFYE